MPELPEVEQVRASIAERVVGLRVVGVTVHRRDVVTGPADPPGGWSRAGASRREGPMPRLSRRLLLEGSRIVEVLRHGKQIAIRGEQGAVGVHLGMTGQLLHRSRGERLAKADHVHVCWKLAQTDGTAAGRLVFRDPRRFGGVWAHQSMEDLAQRRWSGLGPDALTIGDTELIARLRPRRGRAGQPVRCVKAALLDQSTLAGVGNIYADEALFRAGISPLRPVDELTDEQTIRLAKAIREVLEEAVKGGGSTLRDYVDGAGNAGSFQLRHRVYGRGGQACMDCGKVLRSGMVAQRTTVWCERCQHEASVKPAER